MSFVRKSIAVSIGQIVTLACSVVAGVIYSRALRPDGMGQYELFRNTSILVSIIGTLGIGQASIFFLNSRKVAYPQVVTDLFKLGLMLGVPLGLGVIVAVKTMPDYFGALGWAPIVGFGAATMLMIVRNLLRPLLIARLIARGMALVDASQFVLIVATGGVVAALGRLTTGVAINIFTVGVMLSSLILLWYVRDGISWGRRLDWASIKEITWHGIRLGAANVLFILSSSLTILLLRRLSPNDFSAIGLYTRASAVMNLSMLLPVTVGPMLYARWAAAASRDGVTRETEFAVRLHLAYGMGVALIILFTSRYILLTLYGRQYIPASAALTILAFASAMMTMVEPVFQLFMATGHPGRVLLVLAVAFVFLAAGLFALVPDFGIVGASWAAVISNCSALACTFFIAIRHYGVRPAACLLFTPADLSRLVQAARVGRVTAPVVDPAALIEG